MEYMKSVVAPRMKQVFVNFSPDRFGKMNCVTCHGDSATDGSFKMPNPKLPEAAELARRLQEAGGGQARGDGVHEERGEAEDGRAARHARVQPRDEDRLRLHGMPHDGAVRCSRRGFPGTSRRTRSRPDVRDRRLRGDLLDLTESNPTRVGLPYPDRRACARRSARADPARYEPAPLGLPAARAAVAAEYAAAGAAVDPGARRDHRQLQRIVLVPVQAAVRSGRRGADPRAELPALRLPGPPRGRRPDRATGWRSTASGASTSPASSRRSRGARRAARGRAPSSS